MKKFCEFSVKSVKNIKGKIIGNDNFVNVVAKSGAEEVGVLSLMWKKEAQNFCAYAKYLPVEGADDKTIQTLEFSGSSTEVDMKISELLEKLYDSIFEYRMKKSNDFFGVLQAAAFGIVLSEKVDFKHNRVQLPTNIVEITNSVVKRYLGEDWIGIEFVVTEEFKALIESFKSEFLLEENEIEEKDIETEEPKPEEPEADETDEELDETIDKAAERIAEMLLDPFGMMRRRGDTESKSDSNEENDEDDPVDALMGAMGFHNLFSNSPFKGIFDEDDEPTDDDE